MGVQGLEPRTGEGELVSEVEVEVVEGSWSGVAASES